MLWTYTQFCDSVDGRKGQEKEKEKEFKKKKKKK